MNTRRAPTAIPALSALLACLLLFLPAAHASAAREELPASESFLEYVAYEPSPPPDADLGTLFVRLAGDPAEIRYFEVPAAVWAEFKAAPSKGSFYSTRIRQRFERQYGKSRSETFDSPLPVQTRVNALCAFNEECEAVVVEGIEKSRESILVAAYAFTRSKIAAALVRAKRRGVRVAVKMDSRQAQYPQARKILDWLARENIPVQLIYVAGDYSAMHNKFMVFDRRWVVAGSYNFTTTAQVSNWENLIWLDSPEMADQYTEAWRAIVSDEPPPPKEKPAKKAKKSP
jgi:phosphatidylserine/phosphatidylglycerophosphate/cardiolipin synthase-like enzyme